MSVDPSLYLNDVIEIALTAGEKIISFFQPLNKAGKYTVKEDLSPLTKADIAANEIIVKGLASISEYPILSEESTIPSYDIRQKWDAYWLVDPLDGTKEFIRGSEDFTVNIALIQNSKPILGVIVLPVSQSCYYAHLGLTSCEQRADGSIHPLHVASWDKKRELRVFASRRHDNSDVSNIIDRGIACEITRMGSSIKFCYIASGLADFYPRFGSTSEWDTAAGQIILEQAGGKVIDRQGNILRYNTKESLINPHFMAMGDYATIDQIWR